MGRRLSIAPTLRFHVLPLMKQSFPTAGVGGIAAAPAVPASRRALVVDDSELALQFFERTLQGMGLQTCRASRSQDALELISREPFDFVFLDIDLGKASELDGLALCRRIKREGGATGSRTPPVAVLVSVHAGEMDRVRGMLAGCDAFFGKPPDMEAMRKLLAPHGVGEAGATRPRREARAA